MAGIGHYNYAGFPLVEKHGWFQSGPGAVAAMQVGDSLKRIAARMDVSDATIGAGFIERKLGTSWEGNAAKAASGAFDRAAAVLASLSTSSLSGGGTAQQFGDSFNVTKNAIPTPPPPVGVNSTVGAGVDSFVDTVRSDTGQDLSVIGIQSDYRARLVANQNAEHAANDALQRHENTTRDVLDGYQAAAAPTTAAAAQPAAHTSGAAPTATGGTGFGTQTGGSAAGTWGSGVTGGGAVTDGASVGGTATGAAGHPGPTSTGHPGGTSSGTTAAGAGSHSGPATAAASAGSTPSPQVGSGSTPGSSGGFGANGSYGPSSGYGPYGGYGSGGGTAGGYLPAGGAYQPGSSSWTPSSGGRYSGGGTGGGYRDVAGEQHFAPRTGGEPGSAVRGGSGSAGSVGSSSAAAGGRGTSPGGMAPMGMGGVGAGGGDRQHRNQYYIPEDEPFRIDYDFYVAPPVLGAGARTDDSDDR
jgi:hypothetical protein